MSILHLFLEIRYSQMFMDVMFVLLCLRACMNCKLFILFNFSDLQWCVSKCISLI